MLGISLTMLGISLTILSRGNQEERMQLGTHLINREGVRCQGFGTAARREEGKYPDGSLTDEQRRSSSKERQPGGLFSGGLLAALLLSRRALAMLLPRALPPARQKTAHPFPIYEMGSNLPIKGLLFAFGGAVGQATGLVLSKKGMAGYDAFAATQIRIIVGISGFSLLTLLLGRTKQTVAVFGNRKGMVGITIGSFFGLFLGVSLSLYSLKFTSTGIASSIMATVPILIIPPTVLIFKQKVTSKEIAGAVMSVVGVALFFV